MAEKIITRKVLVTVNNIELKDHEVENFKFFMRHYNNIAVMIKNGFFGVRNGSLTIHFDQNGAIASIVKNERVY